MLILKIEKIQKSSINIFIYMHGKYKVFRYENLKHYSFSKIMTQNELTQHASVTK